MRIIGLDMASVTGWALVDTNPVHLNSGIWVLKKGAKLLPLEERMIQFESRLGDLLDDQRPHALVYEIAHHRGGDATRSGIGFEVTCRVRCWWEQVPAFGVHSRSLKKFVTGNGNCDKEVMIEAVNDCLSSQYIGPTGSTKTITDDNEADAIGLAIWGRENLWIDENDVAHLKPTPTKKKRVTKKAKRAKKESK